MFHLCAQHFSTTIQAKIQKHALLIVLIARPRYNKVSHTQFRHLRQYLPLEKTECKQIQFEFWQSPKRTIKIPHPPQDVGSSKVSSRYLTFNLHFNIGKRDISSCSTALSNNISNKVLKLPCFCANSWIGLCRTRVKLQSSPYNHLVPFFLLT